MSEDKVTRALRALGRTAAPETVESGSGEFEARELAGSKSGSGVYRVHLDGHDVVLKVTSAEEEPDYARRELLFYKTLADRVPVRTPRLLGHVDIDEFTVLLLSAHTPSPPAREWTPAAWLEVIRQLAALHECPPPRGAPWVRENGLPQVYRDPPFEVAEECWSRTAASGSLGKAFEAVPDLARAQQLLPDSFVHGDCHVDNLLYDGTELVWADWQVTGIGRPAGDVAFLWGRAFADSADPPYDEMQREYATLRGIDRHVLKTSLIAIELGTLLFAWPHYLKYHPVEERERIAHRLVDVVAEWHTLS